MPEESITPEERLLKLIRRKGNVSSHAAEPVKPPPAASQEPSAKKAPFRPGRFQIFKNLPPLPSFPVFRKKPVLTSEVPFLAYDLFNTSYLFLRVERLLMGLVGLAFLFLLATRLVPHREMTAASLLEKPFPKEVSVKKGAEPKPYDYYGNVIEHRDLFQAGVSSRETRGIPASAVGSRLKDFALIGIISGKTPQAIIEDKKESKTYFLKEGELVGDLRVEQILDEKVILSYEGEQFDLVL